MKVTVLLYQHRHGTDCNVYVNHARAIQGACEIITQFIEEVHDVLVRLQVTQLIEDKNYERALEIWSSYQEEHSSECFEIYESDVIQEEPNGTEPTRDAQPD